MVSLYDVVKAGKGLPIDDPVAALWGGRSAGKPKTEIYEGKLPVTLPTAGGALVDYKIYGTKYGFDSYADGDEHRITVTSYKSGKKTTTSIPLGKWKLRLNEYVSYSEQKFYRLRNYFTGEIVQGNLSASNGQPIDSTNVVRSPEFIRLDAGTYNVWSRIAASGKRLCFCVFVYDTDGNYVTKLPSLSSDGVSTPYDFTLDRDSLVKFTFSWGYFSDEITPQDILEIQVTRDEVVPIDWELPAIPLYEESTEIDSEWYRPEKVVFEYVKV